MKIMVTVKRVIDPYVKIRVKTDNSGVETQNMKMSMNPFDEIALEEAIRLFEKGNATEVIAVSIGSDLCQDILRQALALGADRAILVRTEQRHCSLQIAKILQQIAEREKPELILMGKQSIDDDNNQTPQMLSGLLHWSIATFASEIIPKNGELEVTREIDGGLETLHLSLPAVVSADLRLNEPRYATLPKIMKAKTKPLEIIELSNLNIELKKHKEILSVHAPVARVAGVKLDSIGTLVDKLQNEAKVL
jgi:electron transfer flavoprotein beta subunit